MHWRPVSLRPKDPTMLQHPSHHHPHLLYAPTNPSSGSIRVTTASDSTLEGTLFTADPITNLLAINAAPAPPTPASASTPLQPGDYHIVPIATLQSFTLLSLAPEQASALAGPPSFETAVPTIKSVDLKACKARERAAVEREQRKERARGKGVGREAQEIYDALSRT